jgi:phage tail sheath protein FI
MGFQVSPGVEIKEIDLTNVIPAVSTSIGGFAGHFAWGPSKEPTLVSSEKELANIFGAPTEASAIKKTVDNTRSFLTAASFLKYTNALFVSRAESSTGRNSAYGFDVSNIHTNPISNSGVFETLTLSSGIVHGRYFGAAGNSIKVHIAHANNNGNGSFDNGDIDALVNDVAGTSDWATNNGLSDANDEIHIVVEDADGIISGTKGSILEVFEGLSLYRDAIKDGSTNFYANVINRDSNYIYINNAKFAELFNDTLGAVPGEYGLVTLKTFNNNFIQESIVIFTIDSGETVATRTPGVYTHVDINGAAFKIEISSAGTANVTLLSGGNGYAELDTITIPADDLGDLASPLGADLVLEVSTVGGFEFIGNLNGGDDGTSAAGNIVTALSYLAQPEEVDVNLIFAEQVDSDTSIPGQIVTIAGTTRKDCVGFISPDVTSDSSSEVIGDLNYNSSYVVLDSGAVYVYNKYQDRYQYIPAAGHVAGLCARTDNTNDPWFSPAGYNRGQLLGVTKLKWNPNKSERDELYKKGINPIISQPGQGIILFGDKTAQSKPSAFDRINVRRLFIVLEKAIATAAKYQLFELNDEFTRAMFRNMTEPFLRDVKGRRGITDFYVVCDETNNTGEVIDTNRFVADIYIKPARSINFITLNFIATRTGVEFSEIIGK